MKIKYLILFLIFYSMIGHFVSGALFAMRRTPEWDENDWNEARLVIKLINEKKEKKKLVPKKEKNEPNTGNRSPSE